jgi:hypothetical protein
MGEVGRGWDERVPVTADSTSRTEFSVLDFPPRI